MNTVDEFRAWLESQIDRLSIVPSEHWSQQDNLEARALQGEAYEHAISLRLPQAEIVREPGPVRIRLCELLESLPQPAYLNINQLAELLKVSTRSIPRRIIQGSLPQPMKVGRLSRWSVKDLRDYGINL
jgi:predicted DNA-binding transcriptional regulator AlpA